MSDLGACLMGGAPTAEAQQVFSNALRAVRKHLNMGVAFVSEFTEGRRYFRAVDCANGLDVIRPGQSDPLDASLCEQIVAGRVAELLPDALADPVAGRVEGVRALQVRAHLSVPIHLSDGRLYGTFCCFSLLPDYSLNERDLSVMRAFAEVVALQIEKDLVSQERFDHSRHRIESLMAGSAISTVYQPIFHLADRRIVGFEALSRFSASPHRTPDLWFAEAAQVGLGVELELRAIDLAVHGLDRLPQPVYVSVNASPATVQSGRLAAALNGVPLDRVVIEITEHEAVHHYESLSAALQPLQRQGLRLAIDDAGAGYACFRHILNLSPHMVKLDISITRDVHIDRSRRALAAALCRFTEETGCRIVAEGVESALEIETLQSIGFQKAQGFFLGRPMPIDQAVAIAACATGS